ncbi:MAG TPA: hypothetical protein VI455_08640 [Terriglobia bacterium]
MAKVRGGTYELNQYDFDLQDNPPATDGAARISGKLGTAKNKALELINLNLKQALGLSENAVDLFTLDDFSPSQFGDDKLTGKNGASACEWKAQKTHGNNSNLRTIDAIIDVDDIPEGAVVNGPDRPHVGFSYWAKCESNPAKSVGRVNGHVFIEYVPVSRNS